MQAYINRASGIDFSKVFEQYLTTTMIPALEFKVDSATHKLSYRWTNVVKGFAMPVRASVGAGKLEWLRPTEAWKTYPGTVAASDSVQLDPSFYVTVKSLNAPSRSSN